MPAPLEKLPPQNLEAEKAVLGAMLIEKEAISKTVDVLKSTDFSDGNHQLIFQEIVGLYDADKPVDIVILANGLKKKKLLNQIGGPGYLRELVDAVSTAANVEYYADIVRRSALLREIIDASTRIVTEAYSEKEDAESLLDKAEEMIFNIAGSRTTGRLIPAGDKMHPLISELEKVQHREKKSLLTGIPTGFTELDKLTSGLSPGNLVIVAGRPSMGKTSFSINIALHVGIEMGLPVAIFSTEMSCEELLLRMIAAEARLSMKDMRTGFLPKSEWQKITTVASRIEGAPIYIDDSASLSVREIKHRCRHLMAKKGLNLIIVDYLQLMPGRTGKPEYRQWDVSEISRSLKITAKDLKIPVIAVSQLSRAPEKRAGAEKRPQLSDLRESGAIEQDADLVIFIYRKEWYDRLGGKKPAEEVKGIAEISIGKQRNGPSGQTVKLAFLEDCMCFENLAKEKE